MLPKRGDIIKLDQATEAQPVRSSYGGAGSMVNDGQVELLLEGTLLRYLRTKNDMAIVQVVNPPQVRKMLRQVNPSTNNRQTYMLDAYVVSFHCKKDELKWETV